MKDLSGRPADFGPFSAIVRDGERQLLFNGNLVAAPRFLTGLDADGFTLDYLGQIVSKLPRPHNELARAVQSIDAAIFRATVDLFQSIGAHWCNLPQSTQMISSPGAVYRGQDLDYSVDTLPISIKWFGHEQEVFLSESSQFYLELHLLTQNFMKVFSIYNSFRKEPADAFHLSEFQHIEFEGKVDFNENVDIARSLLQAILKRVLRDAREELDGIVGVPQRELLEDTADNLKLIKISFKDAMDALYKETQDARYQEYSLRYLGAWEEIRITEILGGFVLLTNFPERQVPFYHNNTAGGAKSGLTESADILFPGYREVVGTGVRISDKDLLLRKAKMFNLPLQQYRPYLESRDFGAGRTAGFGIGWQRLTQWILRVPAIWMATVFPRGHLLPIP